MPAISIIIPIYNVESYLSECLDSVIRNTDYFNPSDIEVIMVNDGSNDNSLKVAETYAKSHNSFRLYSQNNSGLSEARNTGIRKATGDYIFFLDSDDILENNAIYELYKFVKDNDCDICQAGMLYYFGDDRDYISSDTTGYKCNTILSKNKALSLLVDNERIKSFACGKLYKAKLVHNVAFPSGKYFEDIYWQHAVIGSCKRYGVLNKALYKYRQRGDSITGTFSFRKLDLLEGYIEMSKYIQLNAPELYQSIIFKLWSNKLLFERQLSNINIQPQSTELQRLSNINAFCDKECRQVLKYKVPYRLHMISPALYRAYIKIKHGFIKLHKLI